MKFCYMHYQVSVHVCSLRHHEIFSHFVLPSLFGLPGNSLLYTLETTNVKLLCPLTFLELLLLLTLLTFLVGTKWKA